MPDGGQGDKQARIGRESTEKARDQEKSCEIVGVMMPQGPSQQPRSQEDAHHVDEQQQPRYARRPIGAGGTRLPFQEQIST